MFWVVTAKIRDKVHSYQSDSGGNRRLRLANTMANVKMNLSPTPDALLLQTNTRLPDQAHSQPLHCCYNYLTSIELRSNDEYCRHPRQKRHISDDNSQRNMMKRSQFKDRTHGARVRRCYHTLFKYDFPKRLN